MGKYMKNSLKKKYWGMSLLSILLLHCAPINKKDNTDESSLNRHANVESRCYQLAGEDGQTQNNPSVQDLCFNTANIIEQESRQEIPDDSTESKDDSLIYFIAKIIVEPIIKSVSSQVPGLNTIVNLIKNPHGKGIGASVNLAFILQGAASIEMMIFKPENTDFYEVGIYCAPGIGFVTDAGAAANIFEVQSLGCKDAQSYSGGFITAGASFSLESVGIPGAVGTNYSIGINGPGIWQKNAVKMRPNMEVLYLNPDPNMKRRLILIWKDQILRL